MRSATVIIFCVAQVLATSDDVSDKLVDKLFEKLTNKLVDKMTQSLDLDSTTLGKAHPDKGLGVANMRGAALPAVMPRNTLMGCPVSVMSRASTIANAQVLLGSDSGGLVFVPDTVTIKAGETVEWKNNAGFPHNIVFDEDNVPDGVNADSLSKEDYLNAPGETHSVKFEKAGTYGYYCEPHRGAGMQGKIVVN